MSKINLDPDELIKKVIAQDEEIEKLKKQVADSILINNIQDGIIKDLEAMQTQVLIALDNISLYLKPEAN